MDTVLVLFTRDLRIRDHPALASASRVAKHVVPTFVIDERLLATGFASPNRLAFLLDSLIDLDRSLARRGARLVVRRGNVVGEAIRLAEATAAKAIFASADVSAYARGREERLRTASAKAGVDLQLFPGVTVASPGGLRTSSGVDHFRVFTPYWMAHGGPPPARVSSVSPGTSSRNCS